MKHSASILLSLVSLAISLGFIQALNLADVPCGNTASGNRGLHQRIVGGAATDITNFPHAISLKKNGVHWCGGSLISRYYVVTAAHCVYGTGPGIWSVTVGEQHRTVPEVHEQTFAAADIRTHQGYQGHKNLNDIALIRLSGPVQWNNYAQPICLPDFEGANFAGKAGYLAGWGFDNQGGSVTDNLNFARMPILDLGSCQQMYNQYNQQNNKGIQISEGQICAGYAEGRTDGCQGDSGGALVSEYNQNMVMVGIMSGGIGCGLPNAPGIYTSISSYVRWITETISQWNTGSSIQSRQYWTGVDTEHRLSHLKRDVEPVLPLDRFPSIALLKQSSFLS